MKTEELSLSWCDIPIATKRLLVEASEHWEDTERSQASIQAAIANPDTPLDVLVAAYRYFFYKHNDALALQVAQRIMDLIRASEALPQSWEELKPILRDRRDEPHLRLYLNAYAASGLVLARLGAIDQATIITEQIREIDVHRESCASTVFNILTQPADEDE